MTDLKQIFRTVAAGLILTGLIGLFGLWAKVMAQDYRIKSTEEHYVDIKREICLLRSDFRLSQGLDKIYCK